MTKKDNPYLMAFAKAGFLPGNIGAVARATADGLVRVATNMTATVTSEGFLQAS